MTCAEFRTTLNNKPPFTLGTNAEAMTLARHMLGCPSCFEYAKRGAERTQALVRAEIGDRAFDEFDAHVRDHVAERTDKILRDPEA